MNITAMQLIEFLLTKKDEPSNQLGSENIKECYVIVRTYSAGVFAGTIVKKDGREVTLINARRLWKWSGAASLSQLAMEGVKNPDDCMFPCEVDRIELLEAIEILYCTEKCKESIKSVKKWEK